MTPSKVCNQPTSFEAEEDDIFESIDNSSPERKLSTEQLADPTFDPQHHQDHQHQHERPNSLEMFDLLTRLQSSRLNDQRCSMPISPASPRTQQPSLVTTSVRTEAKNRLQEVLKFPPPYPMIVLPKSGGFWMDPPSGVDSATLRRNLSASKFETEEFSRIYRNHFFSFEHFNFRAYDEVLGPLVLSVKVCDDQTDDTNSTTSDCSKSVQLIARLNSGSVHKYIHYSELSAPNGDLVPAKLAKWIVPELTTEQLEPVMCPQASELIMQYDEHRIVNTFKFGLIYQKVGQVTEEAMFGNRTHSPAMEEFMNAIGRIIPLADHQGYRGGLDAKHGQTGKYTLYENFHGNEIMFHVSTFLPFVESDPQQLQRKCHIGNDIVAIVFQEGNTPFTPDMIISHFLHAFIVVQPVEGYPGGPTRYKISVTSKNDVPNFGPSFPNGSNIIRKGPELKEFLLTKLMNAETACYRADKFSKLEHRTRVSLLANLDQMLAEKTREFVGGEMTLGQTKSENERKQSSSKIIESVKRALSSKNKNASGSSIGSENSTSSHHAKVSKSKSTLIPFATSQREVISVPPSGDTLDFGGVYRGSVSPARIYGDADSGRGSIETDANHHHQLQRSTTLLSPQFLGRPSAPSTSSRLSSNQAASESDDSSLTSTEEGHPVLQRRSGHSVSPGPPLYSNTISRGEYFGNDGSISQTYQNVISGSVTTVPIEGQSASALQEERLRDEVTKLKGEKLELLRQNVAYQREIKRLRERELQLQTDLTTASREIVRLRMREKDNNNFDHRKSSPVNGFGTSASNGSSKTHETSQHRLL